MGGGGVVANMQRRAMLPAFLDYWFITMNEVNWFVKIKVITGNWSNLNEIKQN